MKKNVIVLIAFVLLVSWGCGSKSAENSADNPGQKNNTAGNKTGANDEALLVEVKTVSPELFEHHFTVNGSVEAVEDAFISPELGGQVKAVHVKEGQRVRKGQLLVSLNSDVLNSSIAEVESGLELATTLYERQKGLWEKKIGTEIQYLQAKTNKESLESRLKALKAQLKMNKIQSPIHGIVDEVFQKVGELAVPGLQLMQVVNLKKVYINADVSESYLAKVHKGDTVGVHFPSYPELDTEVNVFRTGNVVKKQNRTFRVQLLLDNEAESLKPNMLAQLTIKDFSADAALLVPSIVLKNDLQGTYLFVTEKSDGKTAAKKIYVTPGISSKGKTMVTEGLKPGQQVIVKGFNLVKNGMPVRLKS